MTTYTAMANSMSTYMRITDSMISNSMITIFNEHQINDYLLNDHLHTGLEGRTQRVPLPSMLNSSTLSKHDPIEKSPALL
eukprot:215231-Pelagomonas_calceolata.AAC.10